MIDTITTALKGLALLALFIGSFALIGYGVVMLCTGNWLPLMLMAIGGVVLEPAISELVNYLDRP